MLPKVPRLQRSIGIGGATTFLALLALGLPIYLNMGGGRDLGGFLVYDLTIVLTAMIGLFIATALLDAPTARLTQVLILLSFGFATIALGRPGRLNGLPIAGIGVILAAHYGFLQKQVKLKAALILVGLLGALLVVAIRETTHISATYRTLTFMYDAVGVLGLTVAYTLVLRDAAAEASTRQAQLQKTVEERTSELREEIVARKEAEQVAQLSAERAENLAEQRLELLREVHHRAKNSLQMTLTLLETLDWKSPDAMSVTINRVRAIGLVYDLVDAAQDLSTISLEEYIQSLAEHIQMGDGAAPVQILYSPSGDHQTQLDATINLGLMIHEIIRIARTHALCGTPGIVNIVQQADSKDIVFEIDHTGSLLPDSADPRKGDVTTLGLLPAFAQRLHCNIDLHRRETNFWRVAIPKGALVKEQMDGGQASAHADRC